MAAYHRIIRSVFQPRRHGGGPPYPLRSQCFATLREAASDTRPGLPKFLHAVVPGLKPETHPAVLLAPVRQLVHFLRSTPRTATSPPRSSTRSRIVTASSPPGSSARSASRGRRRPAARPTSTDRCWPDEGLGGRRLARPRPRARAPAADAARAGRRARRRRERAGVGSGRR
jgi:hypothetical protein